MVAAPVLWSSAGVVTRHIQRAEPFEQVFWRSLFAFAFVLVVLLIRRQHPWLSVRAAGVPGLVSGLMWAIMFTAFLFALSLTTTANALVVMSISPLLTALFAAMFLKDPVPVRTLFASAAAALGIAWMFGSSLESHYLGMAVASLIPVAAAINVVVLRGAAAPAASIVRTGTGSFRKTFAKRAVRSGATLITTSAFAVVVSDSANRKAVNMIAHIRPETRPGHPAERTEVHGCLCWKRSTRKTKAKAKMLRQNTCSKGAVRSMWRVTTPALDQSTGAAIISATATARECIADPCLGKRSA